MILFPSNLITTERGYIVIPVLWFSCQAAAFAAEYHSVIPPIFIFVVSLLHLALTGPTLSDQVSPGKPRLE